MKNLFIEVTLYKRYQVIKNKIENYVFVFFHTETRLWDP